MTFDMFKYHDVNLTFCDSKFLNVNKIKYESQQLLMLIKLTMSTVAF